MFALASQAVTVHFSGSVELAVRPLQQPEIAPMMPQDEYRLTDPHPQTWAGPHWPIYPPKMGI
eukprot:495497-Pyramimonas_sp.AAC.1